MAIKINQLKPHAAIPESAKTSHNHANDSTQLSIGDLFKKRLSLKDKERFYGELNLMISAGVELASALLFIVQDAPNALKPKYDGLLASLINGASFSESLRISGEFTEYEYVSVRIGEETGRLSDVLVDLNKYYSVRIKQRRLIISALSYPFLVFMTSCAAVFFMLNVVVPMFEDVFARFGNELPALTKFIIDISDFFAKYFLWMFLFVLIVIVTGYFVRREEMFRRVMAKLTLNVPFFGNLIHMSHLARFSSAMYLMLSAKNPLDSSVGLIAKMIGFYPIEKALTSVQRDIVSGVTLSGALGKHDIFPKRMVSLVEMSEEVNKLDLIFKKLSEQYTEEVNHKSALAGSVLEPLLIIFIGSIVAIILIAMYLPMFQMSSSLG